MPESTSRMCHCKGVSLSPDMPLRFPGLEQPGPEVAGLPQIALEARPELPDLAGGEEGEDVVRLGLPHELAGQVGADLRVRILEPGAELLQGHLGVPEEIGLPFRVDEALWRGRVEHGGRSSLSQRSYPGRDIGSAAREEGGTPCESHSSAPVSWAAPWRNGSSPPATS